MPGEIATNGNVKFLNVQGSKIVEDLGYDFSKLSHLNPNEFTSYIVKKGQHEGQTKYIKEFKSYYGTKMSKVSHKYVENYGGKNTIMCFIEDGPSTVCICADFDSYMGKEIAMCLPNIDRNLPIQFSVYDYKRSSDGARIRGASINHPNPQNGQFDKNSIRVQRAYTVENGRLPGKGVMQTTTGPKDDWTQNNLTLWNFFVADVGRLFPDNSMQGQGNGQQQGQMQGQQNYQQNQQGNFQNQQQQGQQNFQQQPQQQNFQQQGNGQVQQNYQNQQPQQQVQQNYQQPQNQQGNFQQPQQQVQQQQNFQQQPQQQQNLSQNQQPQQQNANVPEDDMPF